MQAAAIDGKKTADSVYRLFVVVAPSDRPTLGSYLLSKLRECLMDLVRAAHGLWNTRRISAFFPISKRWGL